MNGSKRDKRLFYAYRFVRCVTAICCLIMILENCEKQSSIKSPGASTKGPLVGDFCFWQLPLRMRTIMFNVGRGNVVHPPPNGTLEFFDALNTTSDAFTKENAIKLNNPYGHFIVSQDLKVIGFSLLPINESAGGEAPLGLVRKCSSQEGFEPLSHRGYDIWLPLETAESGTISVRSVDALLTFKTLGFIDFGISGFANGVWDSLARVASSGGLRGLMVFRGAHMLAVRKDNVIPEIRGLVVHVKTIEELRQFGRAFPNLRFLCLCIPNGDLIGEMMQRDVLNEFFSGLRGIMIASNRLEANVKLANETNNRTQPRIRFDSKLIPASLEWLCLDGSLLSMDNKVLYDHLALELRYESPVLFDHLIKNRDLDVVFTSFGFAGGGANAADVFGYLNAEKFWRE